MLHQTEGLTSTELIRDEVVSTARATTLAEYLYNMGNTSSNLSLLALIYKSNPKGDAGVGGMSRLGNSLSTQLAHQTAAGKGMSLGVPTSL